MSVIVKSIGLRGMSGYIVKVEVKVINGFSSFTIVGLPDLSVKEAKQRVMATLLSLENVHLLEKKIIINLSPAEQKKNGPFFDLAIAIGIVIEMELFPIEMAEDTAFLGALSLDGTVQPIEGVLPALLAAKHLGLKRIVCPYHPSLQGLEIDGINIIYVSTFEETIQFLLNGEIPIKKSLPTTFGLLAGLTYDEQQFQKLNFSNIIGHTFAKRALEIAAAGGHNVLMFGPPGCGKSLLAENFPSILPPLTSEQQLEVLSLYQLAAASASKPPLNSPPFRQPHHSSSAVSLIGGGSNPKPGEVSLAHNGVLFLDEMAEFTKKALDMLRQPIESGKITISRALSTVTYPARFILIAALNPCPCGFRHSSNRFCLCSPKQILAYRRKISGPIMDRLDIILYLKSVEMEKENRVPRESSETIKKRVIKARDRQFIRYGNSSLNSYVASEKLLTTSAINYKQKRTLQKLAMTHHLSTRVQMKIIRVARTISDLQGEESISNQAIEEAIALRQAEL
jgi:magnesium chelatase family protein